MSKPIRAVYRGLIILIVLVGLPFVWAWSGFPAFSPSLQGGLAYYTMINESNRINDPVTISVWANGNTLMTDETTLYNDYFNGMFGRLDISWDDPDTVRDEGVTYDAVGEDINFRIDGQVVTSISSTNMHNPTPSAISNSGSYSTIRITSSDAGVSFGYGLEVAAEPSSSFSDESTTETGSTCEPWVCGEWSSCDVLGRRYRTCTDLYDCNSVNEKPSETEDCSVQMLCSNNILNEGERGVDCGGLCQPCTKEEIFDDADKQISKQIEEIKKTHITVVNTPKPIQRLKISDRLIFTSAAVGVLILFLAVLGLRHKFRKTSRLREGLGIGRNRSSKDTPNSRRLTKQHKKSGKR